MDACEHVIDPGTRDPDAPQPPELCGDELPCRRHDEVRS